MIFLALVTYGVTPAVKISMTVVCSGGGRGAGKGALNDTSGTGWILYGIEYYVDYRVVSTLLAPPLMTDSVSSTSAKGEYD